MPKDESGYVFRVTTFFHSTLTRTASPGTCSFYSGTDRSAIRRYPRMISDAPVSSYTRLYSPFQREAPRGIHDFYSEGDYWWPNPEAPDGPYIRRDGETNPENFTAHRQAMIRMSQLVGDLTSAWILTGKQVYSDAAMQHIRAWFVNPDTQMNPNLLYAQAIKGVATGRGIGIIDTIHLIEVVQSLRLMEAKRMIDKEELGAIKQWFSDYLTWMSTHRYGIKEMEAKNNHGT